MRTRTHLLLLVVVALLAGAVGSIAAVASTTGTAHACSIAGPYGEVWPSTDLQPGQQIEILGWGFNDILLNEPQPQVVPPGHGDTSAPPELCDFTVAPMSNLDVYWRGAPTVWLGTVSGPDFANTVTVPADASPGPATIAIGTVELTVFVGQTIEIPEPCPLTMGTDGTISHVCPEPWPCPGATTSGTQPAPDANYAPGSSFPCPEPCVDAAHTIDDGTVYDWQWDCPEPCSYIDADPGAVQPDHAPGCPPPEPCPVHIAGVSTAPDPLIGCPDPCGPVGGDAIWCPPVDPCPVYLMDAPVDAESFLVNCPDPCQIVGGDAVWCPPEWCPIFMGGQSMQLDAPTECPPPEPCVGYPTNAVAEEPDLAQWCPPPEPCPVYIAGASTAPDSLIGCPDPCGLVGGDAVWCPPIDPCPVHLMDGLADAESSLAHCPDPCQVVGGDAVWCPPAPCQLVGGDAMVCPQATNTGPAADLPDSGSTTSGDAVPVQPASAPPVSTVPVQTTTFEIVVSDSETSTPKATEPEATEPVAPEPVAPRSTAHVSPSRTAAEQMASNLVAQMSQRMADIAGLLIARILG